MFTLHCTKKLLDLVKPAFMATTQSTNQLGAWYATSLAWKPEVALFVNERTLIPVLIPLAPNFTLVQRFSEHLAPVLSAHGVAAPFIEDELRLMQDVVFAKTENRSVVGIMKEFAALGACYKNSSGTDNLLGLSLKLAQTPCYATTKNTHWPDKVLQELVLSKNP
jgi:hypothetical protein